MIPPPVSPAESLVHLQSLDNLPWEQPRSSQNALSLAELPTSDLENLAAYLGLYSSSFKLPPCSD